MITASEKQMESAIEVFRRFGGMLRTGEALRRGIHRRTLYAMRDTGILERLERGLYRLAELPPLTAPDLVTVMRKLPKSVICLISALSFHEITTQIPHAIHIAVKRGTEAPRLNHPPTKVYWFSGEEFTAGVKTHSIDATTVHVYSAEKTLADCFKYRRKIGMNTVLEALAMYREQPRPRTKQLLRFARICRVEKVMRPYLEATF